MFSGPLPPKDDSTIYICSPVEQRTLLETPHMTSKIYGVFAYLLEDYYEFVRIRNLTIRWIAYPGVGERIGNTDSYTGCIGLMQSGLAEGMLYPLEYPVDMENVTQGYLLMDDRKGFMGSFPLAKFKPFDFLGTFSSFNLLTWFIIFVLLFLFRFFMYIHLQLEKKFNPHAKKRTRDAMFRIFSHFSGRGQIEMEESEALSVKVLWILLTIFSFLCITIFSGLMNTGLVVSKPPLTFKSYEHLMKYNVKPSFFDQLILHRHFIHAEPGTPEHKLMTWSQRRFQKDDLIVKVRVLSLMEVTVETVNYERVLFAMESLLKVVRVTLCDLLARAHMKGIDNFKDLHPRIKDMKAFKFQSYIQYPPSLKTQVMQMIISKTNRFSDYFNSIVFRVRENGLLNKRYSQVTGTAIVHPLGGAEFWGSKTDVELKETCLQSTLVPDNKSADELSVVTFASMQTCYVSFALFVVILICVLGHEKVKYQMRSKRRRDALVQMNSFQGRRILKDELKKRRVQRKRNRSRIGMFE